MTFAFYSSVLPTRPLKFLTKNVATISNNLYFHLLKSYSSTFCVFAFLGEDIEFLSFMRLMGLDLTALAQQMGLDERALSMVSPAEALVMIAEAARN